jgi:2-polyprenyl-3-methyl-5-hydroxy-6-metoxy-1,4-benzoquinol methylase
MVSQQLEKALERATLDGFENDYFLEESRERELAYSKACFYRWRDTLETALRFLGGGEGKSVLDVGVSQLTLCLPDFFKTVYGLDLTSAFEPRCSRKGIKLFHGGVHLDDTVTMIPPVDCALFLDAIEHIHANPVEILARLRSRLRANGILIVSTCNMMCLGNRVRMLFNRKLRHFTYPPFQKPMYAAHGFAHDRIYGPEELGDYMVSAGFTQMECLYPMGGDERLAKSPAKFLSYALKAVMPSLRDTMMFVGRK